MKYHAGILDGNPEWDPVQALVLAHTPGIPLEWLYAALGIKKRRRAKLIQMIADSPDGEFPMLGLENAASVTHADGWKMLEVVCPGYSGPVALMSQMALRNDRRPDAIVAQVLGVDRKKVWRWRNNAVFDPLTGVRLVPSRGRKSQLFV
jgi:hypothetical protein